ncbi:MAG: hypothetical protein EXQ88_07690 [Alphaproteobacteria bacterium]|nr:hypothetical protein [Alphaproteobacteria bacterium]
MLPLPLWLWVTGAGATIVLTFVVVALFVRERVGGVRAARLDLARFALVRWLIHPAVIAGARAVAVFMFLLTLASGFWGEQDPFRNLVPTMVWVVWWVGFAFLCALVGDLWAFLSPITSLFDWGAAIARCIFGVRAWFGVPYPKRLGAWPAVALFAGFAWCELVWSGNDEPRALAQAIVFYTLIAWAGMAAFGRDVWLARGEAFAIVFGIFGRFAPLAVEDGRLVLCPLGAGLLADARVSPSLLVFVLLMLSTVTFDGFLETPLAERVVASLYGVESVSAFIFQASEWGISDVTVVRSAALLIFPLLFIGAFLAASWAMLKLAGVGALSTLTAACAFVLTLVPIAVAYHLSHYASLLLTAGQFIVPLLSDPFGFGWDLFGTADYKVNIGLVRPYALWYGATAIIVIGHVVAVYQAHVVALRVFGSAREALISQMPMIALMVGYTMISLWILAQPIVG